MPTKKELEADIKLLLEMLASETKRANEWQEVAEHGRQSTSELQALFKDENKNFRIADQKAHAQADGRTKKRDIQTKKMFRYYIMGRIGVDAPEPEKAVQIRTGVPDLNNVKVPKLNIELARTYAVMMAVQNGIIKKRIGQDTLHRRFRNLYGKDYDKLITSE